MNVKVIFESDHPPGELARFISLLPSRQFGINYDMGNSASLGYNPVDEFSAYGDRILNVHVKDRIRHGSTTALMTGEVDFPLIFSKLREINYSGNYILQTARAIDGKHVNLILEYSKLVSNWINSSG